MSGDSKFMSVYDSSLRLIHEARQSASARRWGEAEALLRQALELDYRSVPAWMNLASVLRASGDPAGALAAVESAKKLQPLNVHGTMLLASLQEETGEPRLAALSYGAALD